MQADELEPGSRASSPATTACSSCRRSRSTLDGETHAAVNDAVVAERHAGPDDRARVLDRRRGPRHAAVRRAHLRDAAGLDRLQPLERRPGARVGPRRDGGHVRRAAHAARAAARRRPRHRARGRRTARPTSTRSCSSTATRSARCRRRDSRAMHLGPARSKLATLPEQTFFRRYGNVFGAGWRRHGPLRRASPAGQSVDESRSRPVAAVGAAVRLTGSAAPPPHREPRPHPRGRARASTPGLNAITGETGAGKTILSNAIGLLLGARGDAAAIGAAGGEAYVEAEFDLPDERRARRARGAAARGRGDARRRAADLRRRAHARLRLGAQRRARGRRGGGRGPARDERPVRAAAARAAELPARGARRVRRARARRVREARRAWRELRRRGALHDELTRDAAAAEARLDELRALVADTEGLEPGAEDELRAERERLRHVTELAAGAAAAAAALTPEDERRRGRPRRARPSAPSRRSSGSRPSSPRPARRSARRSSSCARRRPTCAASSTRSRPSPTGVEAVEAELERIADAKRRYRAADLRRAARARRRRRGASWPRSTTATIRPAPRPRRSTRAQAEVDRLHAELRARAARRRAGVRRSGRGGARRASASARASSAPSSRDADPGASGADEVDLPRAAERRPAVRRRSPRPRRAASCRGSRSRSRPSAAARRWSSTRSTPASAARPRTRSARRCAGSRRARRSSRSRTCRRSRASPTATSASRRSPGDPTHTRIEPLDADERREELERMLGGADFLARCASEARGRRASCSPRAPTSGRSSPSRTTSPTGGRASAASQPDRRGFAPGARWEVMTARPAPADRLARAEAADDARRRRGRAVRALDLAPDRATCRSTSRSASPRAADDRTLVDDRGRRRAALANPKKLARTAVDRLYDLVQTAAEALKRRPSWPARRIVGRWTSGVEERTDTVGSRGVTGRSEHRPARA